MPSISPARSTVASDLDRDTLRLGCRRFVALVLGHRILRDERGPEGTPSGATRPPRWGRVGPARWPPVRGTLRETDRRPTCVRHSTAAPQEPTPVPDLAPDSLPLEAPISARNMRDRTADVLGVSRNPLESFFAPASVAVIGATEKVGSVGRTVFWNLISSPFGGTVYPVNKGRASILGVRAYPNLAALPEVPELVVIVTPAVTIPATVEECAAAGVKAVVIISAGFKEIGPEGAELERQILATARANGMRIVGPNCLGVMRPPTGLNATFAIGVSDSGSVGFVSQSGALLHRGPRLEHAREGRLQRGRLARLDARRGLGRRHHLLRQRPGDREHRHLHGDDRRRPGLPLGGPRGRPHEADHRHQARPDGPGGQGRGVAHRLAHRLRRGPRRRLPTRRCPACRRDRRRVRRRSRCWPSSRARPETASRS